MKHKERCLFCNARCDPKYSHVIAEKLYCDNCINKVYNLNFYAENMEKLKSIVKARGGGS